MDIDYTVGEVELSYKPKFKSLHQVTCSEYNRQNEMRAV